MKIILFQRLSELYQEYHERQFNEFAPIAKYRKVITEFVDKYKGAHDIEFLLDRSTWYSFLFSIKCKNKVFYFRIFATFTGYRFVTEGNVGIAKDFLEGFLNKEIEVKT